MGARAALIVTACLAVTAATSAWVPADAMAAAAARPKKKRARPVPRAGTRVPAAKPLPAVPYVVPLAPQGGRFSHAGGLEVRWLALPGPVTTVLLVFPAGHRSAPAGAPGLPGLVLALLDEGSRRMRPGDHERFVTRLGGRVVRALTGDALIVGATVPASALEALVPLLAELVSGPVARSEALGAALDTLTPEPRTPATSARELARDLVLARGSEGELGLDPVGAATSHARTHLVARGAVLVLAGDVDEARARAAADALGVLASTAPPPPVRRGELPRGALRRRSLPPAGAGTIALGFRGPGGTDGGALGVALLAHLLDDGEGGRLRDALVRRSRVALEVGLELVIEADASALVIFATPRAGTTLPALERAVREELARTTRDPPPPHELARAARGWAVARARALADPAGAAGWLATLFTTHGDPALATTLAAPASVGPGDVLAAARRVFLDQEPVVIAIPAAQPPAVGGGRAVPVRTGATP